MRFIKDSTSFFNRASVTITANEDDNIEDGITLAVHDPLIGDLAPQWTLAEYPQHPSQWCKIYGKGTILESSLHTRQLDSPNEFELLVERVKNGEVTWGTSSTFLEEAPFVSGYWEWLEDVLSRNKDVLEQADIYKAVYASLFSYDCSPKIIQAFCEMWCPSTNTLHTSNGELSLSLWDLRKIGGLPIRGQIYDEVVPSASELLGEIESSETSLPCSCKYLICAFTRLCNKKDNSHQVSISSWVKFWFRRPSTYSKPRARTYKKRDGGCPRMTKNPTGVIDHHFKRSALDESPFVELGVHESIKEEVYTAALLSCWLCKFVFPGKEINFIRPSVFKPASMMAHGKQLSLAVPALACIYNGFREISTSLNLESRVAAFPMHYVYAWLGVYFNSHHRKERDQNKVIIMASYGGERMGKHFSEPEARDLLKNADLSSLQPLSLCRDKKQWLTDAESLPMNCSEYFISNRSSYLTMRRNNEYIFELYSPHRFSAQFGFYQHVPGGLQQKISAKTLQDVYQAWESCIRTNTRSTLIIPSTSERKAIASSTYVQWWSDRRNIIPPKSTKIILKSVVVDPYLPRPKKARLIKAKETQTPVQLPQTPGGTSKSRDATSSERTRSETPMHQPYNQPLVAVDNHKEKSTQAKVVNYLIEQEGEESSSEDQHWKRKRSTPHNPTLANNFPLPVTTDIDEFFEGVPSSCMPIEVESGDSIDGPHKFDLVAGKIESKHSTLQATEKKNKEIESQQAPPQFNLLSDNDSPVQKNVPAVQYCQAKLKSVQHYEASIFCAARVVSKGRRLLASSLWQDLQEKIARTTDFERVSNLAKDAKDIIDVIAENKEIDTLPLRVMVDSFFHKAERFSNLHSEFAKSMSLEAQEKYLGAAATRLHEAEATKMDEANNNESIKAKLTSNRLRQAELLKEIEKLNMEHKELETSLQQSDAKLFEICANIPKIQSEIYAIENAPVLGDSDMKQLNMLRDILKASFDELTAFEWSP